ncbi:MAG: 3-hydroxyacyl-CoA dehydrogenase NAD-binding domain-containing protein [Gammaproteobacteria bacterium]
MENSNQITVVGAGFMGAVIAPIYAKYGYGVVLHDANAEVLASFAERARPVVASIVEPGPDADAAIDKLINAVRLEQDLATAVDGSFLVHEAIPEQLPLKQALFGQLDSLCPPDVVLGTNTSSFRLSDICSEVDHRERVVGIHYITPAHIVKAVEVITADFTPPALVEWTRKFMESIEHVAIVCKESPGFLVNRLQAALVAEAHRVVDEGLSTPQDIDNMMRLSVAPRWALWGPMATEDLVVNKRTVHASMGYMGAVPGLAHFGSTELLDGMIEQGMEGAISGQGWYRWEDDHDAIVTERDRQMSELLEWLDDRDPMASIGMKKG